VLFNFNSLNTSSTASQIGAAMSTQMGSTVTVTGNVQVNTTYDGDAHVTGPVISGTVVPWTLGDMGGTVLAPTAPTTKTPTFNPYLATTSSFTLNFSAPITSVQFDFEIFPDASPPVPTFEFSAADASNNAATLFLNGTTNVGTQWTVNAIASGANDPYLPGNPATYTHSVTSGPTVAETTNQLLGAVTFTFNKAVTHLTFADWPQEIGVDNLVVTTATPAPPSAILLGFGALGIVGFVTRSRRRLAAAA
jgi:hypothetical protein